MTVRNQPINKILFIIEQPFTTRLKNVYQIEKLRSWGLEVRIWDLAGYLHPDFSIKIDVHERLGPDECERCTKDRDVVRALSEITPDTRSTASSL